MIIPVLNTVIIIFKNTKDKTKEIEFSNFNNKTNTIDVIKTINIDEIKKNNYALNINDYKERVKINVSNKFEIKKLNELCYIISSGNRIVGNASEQGIYNFYSSSIEKI